jgi:hypothetical protein
MTKILGILLFVGLAVSAAPLVHQGPQTDAQPAPLMYAGIRG